MSDVIDPCALSSFNVGAFVSTDLESPFFPHVNALLSLRMEILGYSHHPVSPFHIIPAAVYKVVKEIKEIFWSRYLRVEMPPHRFVSCNSSLTYALKSPTNATDDITQ